MLSSPPGGWKWDVDIKKESAERWWGRKMVGQKDGGAERWWGRKMVGQKDGRAERW
jgi:hypothetical protein